MQQKKMVRGLPQLESPTRMCEDCLIGKQHRDEFPKKSTWRATQALEMVHSDSYGPINPASNSNKR